MFFGRHASGDECSGLAASFDDKHAKREAGDDAIASGEVLGIRRRVQGEFGDDGSTGCGDLVKELPVVGGIALGQAAADDGNGAAANAQSGTVGGGIDAACTPGDDAEASLCQMGRESFGLLDAVVGTGTGANNGDWEAVMIAWAELATDIDDGGSILNGGEQGRVVWIGHGQEVNAELGCGVKLALGACERFRKCSGDGGGAIGPDAADGLPLDGGGGKSSVWGCEVLKSAPDQDWAEARNEGEAEGGDGGRHTTGRWQGEEREQIGTSLLKSPDEHQFMMRVIGGRGVGSEEESGAVEKG